MSLRLKQDLEKIFYDRSWKAPRRHVTIAQLRDANAGSPVTSLLAALAVVH